jgi:hypothetical protein
MRCRTNVGTTGVVLVASIANPASAGIEFSQPHDLRAFSPSEQGTAIPFARTADDYFNIAPKARIVSITVWMIVSFPDSPASYGLERYVGDDQPETLINDFPLLSVNDLGLWNGQENLHLIEVLFNGELLELGVGRAWLSPYAIGNGSGTDRGWWGTSGNGVVNGLEGHFISEHFGVSEWTPISQSGILDFPTDFAMRIVATPTPGAAALFGLGVGSLGWRRRAR